MNFYIDTLAIQKQKKIYKTLYWPGQGTKYLHSAQLIQSYVIVLQTLPWEIYSLPMAIHIDSQECSHREREKKLQLITITNETNYNDIKLLDFLNLNKIFCFTMTITRY